MKDLLKKFIFEVVIAGEFKDGDIRPSGNYRPQGNYRPDGNYRPGDARQFLGMVPSKKVDGEHEESETSNDAEQQNDVNSSNTPIDAEENK